MDELGTIISVDSDGTIIKDDAFSIDFDNQGNYILKYFVADPITHNGSNIINIFQTFRNYSNTSQSIYIKKELGNYSLSETVENPVFCFTVTLSPNIDILNFNIEKTSIMVDLEMTETDVIESVNDDSYITEYLAIADELGEKICKKIGRGISYDEVKVRFPFYFPSEFSALVNTVLTEKFLESNLPLIYLTKSDNIKKEKYILNAEYYTYEPTEYSEGKYYTKFTSPLRNLPSLLNLKMFNDLVFYGDLSKKELYKNLIDGYISIWDDEFKFGGNSKK